MTTHTKRRARLWALHRFDTGRGLEIGPLHAPIAHRPRTDVHYLDVHDRAELVRAYAANPAVDTDRIPEIDFTLQHDGVVRDIPGAIGDAPPFDWVIASHVVEHVPDLVGWLDQVARVTVDHGRLLLAVPDRRYCFDVHRPATTVGQVLEAHEAGAVIPSVRAVYDHNRSIVKTSARELWHNRPPGYDARSLTPESVALKVDLARSGQYVDSHVWTFTPGSFVEQVVELRALGLSAWAVDAIEPTHRFHNEFQVALRRLPRDEPWTDDLLASEPEPASMPDWLAQEVDVRARARWQRERADRLRRRADDLQRTTRAQQERIRELEAQLGRRPAVAVRRRARAVLRRATDLATSPRSHR